MWVYRTGLLEPHPFILYEYQKGRKADYPRQFLKDFRGICVTDGYEVYHSIAREREKLMIAGCWSHARRDFADVVKSAGKEKRSVEESICYKALQIIQTMFRYGQGHAEMPPEERLEQRKRNVAPLVDAFFAYLKYEPVSYTHLLDLISISDTTCPMSYSNACFRVCNLAYYSGAINAAIGNVYFDSVSFRQAASFSSMMSGNYTVHVSRSARPETTLVTTTVSMRPRRIYTLYILNWNPSPDTIQTLMVEDRRD